METVTIPKEEYEALKKKMLLADLDKLKNQDLARGLRDLIEGRVTEVKIKTNAEKITPKIRHLRNRVREIEKSIKEGKTRPIENLGL